MLLNFPSYVTFPVIASQLEIKNANIYSFKIQSMTFCMNTSAEQLCRNCAAIFTQCESCVLASSHLQNEYCVTCVYTGHYKTILAYKELYLYKLVHYVIISRRANKFLSHPISFWVTSCLS